MPRKGRIDFIGALHHVIIRGINRSVIFRDDSDRKKFIRLLEAGLDKTGISCYAWALIPNHAHLLLRTGSQPLSNLMRSILTAYAIYFNHRHQRVGYLFQNRYKSILCNEETYLLQLIRYIHLNPLRAGLVLNITELNNFSWCGHSVILGKRTNDWQDTSTVLRRFGAMAQAARKRYMEFVIKGIPEGRRPDLVGGGLIRSAGGWLGVQNLKNSGERWRGDERILGNNDFVLQALKIAKEQLVRKEEKKSAGWNFSRLLQYVSDLCGADPKRILQKKKDQITTNARSLFAWWATNELGYTGTEVADYLSISTPAVSKATLKGCNICRKEGLKLVS